MSFSVKRGVRADCCSQQRKLLVSIALGVLSGLSVFQPQRAFGANECGAATPSGSVTCSAATYPSGITYNPFSGLTVNVASGTTVSRSSGSAAVDLEGSGPLTLNALGATVTGSGTGANFTFSGPNFRPAIYYGVLGYSSNGPLNLNVGQVTDATSGGILGIGGYSKSGAVTIQSTSLNLTGLSAIGINAEGASATVTSGLINATLRGIVAFGDAGNVNVTSGTINIVDNSMFVGAGIQAYALSGQGNITVNSGTITASGSSVVAGILAQSATSKVVCVANK
jgi:hypothetical protein